MSTPERTPGARELILNGVFNQNPVFRLALSLCPAVAVTRHPAPLARILHEAFEFVEFGIVLQGVDRQFQQRRVAVRILTAAEEPAPVNRGS